MLMILPLAITLAAFPAPTHIFRIDLGKSKPISPYIYGINYGTWPDKYFPYTLGRLGGNRMTAYNWETNASNAGNDYKFQSDGFMGESDAPGWTLKNFLRFDESHYAASIITIPTAGYVSADKKGDGDVRLSPNYLETRFNKSLPAKPGPYAYPPDLTDHLVYQDECVDWLEKIKSPAYPLWFMLDNEPDLWASTHAEIHPHPPTYAEIIQNNIAYAKAIKKAAPNTLVFGPANYGWQGFHTFQSAPDANGRDFLDTYLDAMKSAEAQEGKRLLDVLDVHWYPEAQGGGVRVTEGDKPETNAARIQAPRSLWDPTYVEKSWISDSIGHKPIVLLPTILSQIQTHYPGTKFSLSEYNYGGNKTISGAIAQADVLGIFGRYGLFAACNWGIDKADVGQIEGFKSFINFDNKGGHFLDQELSVTGETPSENSVYASVDSKDPKHVVIVAINKTDQPQKSLFDLGKPYSKLEGFETTRTKLNAESHGVYEFTVILTTKGGKEFDFVLPPLSITSFSVTLK
jgi:hypothetical protein